MRVLLTGATGFVGSHVARALFAAGHEVRALRRKTAGPDRPDPVGMGGLSVEWVTGDLVDAASLRRAVEGCEAVIHTAAEVRFTGGAEALARQRTVNVDGTRNVVEAAVGAGVSRLVFTSSSASLGRAPRGGVADETQPYDWPPGFPYNESKRDSERIALAANARGVPAISLNPTMVLGPEAPHDRQLRAMRLIQRGLFRLVPPGGLTLCDVREVARAHVTALTRGKAGERYLLGGPHLTYRALIDLYAKALHAPGPIGTVPAILLEAAALPLFAVGHLFSLPFTADYLTALADKRFYSSDKARAELDYKETPAADLIADTVAWYRAIGRI